VQDADLVRQVDLTLEQHSLGALLHPISKKKLNTLSKW